MKRILRMAATFGLMTLLICAGSFPAAAATIWYNGDMDNIDAMINGFNMYSGTVPQASVYDDFEITGGGAIINTVWSNNAMNFTASTAHWEIRSGVSAGVEGTLIASGDAPCTQTPTGRTLTDALVATEYTIQVTGLSIPLEPGFYWLTVNPIYSGTATDALSYVTTTIGTNAVGQPPGNNGNSFFNSETYEATFAIASNYTYDQVHYLPDPADFSMGVAGSAVPLPPTVLLLASGLAGLGLLRLRKRLKA
jgi:hypothetical protein